MLIVIELLGYEGYQLTNNTITDNSITTFDF